MEPDARRLVLERATSFAPPSLSPRASIWPSEAGLATALIGPRRSGKTWRMYQQMTELAERGVPRDQMFYLNLEDERLIGIDVAELSTLISSWRATLAGDPPVGHLFLDEVQNVHGWERLVRRLTEERELAVAVTGSSAQLLSGELATSLRGRATAVEIHPFSFAEWWRHRLRGMASPPAPGPDHLSAYLQAGGFPETLDLDERAREVRLQAIADVVVLRDVVERHGIRNIEALRSVVRHLLANSGTLFSANQLLRRLKSQGLAISAGGLSAWLAHLTDAFLTDLVPVHDRSLHRQQVNPRKVHIIDPGLVSAHQPLGTARRGHLLESTVAWHLRRHGARLAWHRTRSGREVDLVAAFPDRRRWLVQVTWSISEETTRTRELAALDEAADETRPDRTILIVGDQRGSSEHAADVGPPIEIVGAVEWLLDARGE